MQFEGVFQSHFRNSYATQSLEEYCNSSRAQARITVASSYHVRYAMHRALDKKISTAKKDLMIASESGALCSIEMPSFTAQVTLGLQRLNNVLRHLSQNHKSQQQVRARDPALGCLPDLRKALYPARRHLFCRCQQPLQKPSTVNTAAENDVG